MNTQGTSKIQPGAVVEVRVSGTVEPDRPGDAHFSPNGIRVRYTEVEPGIFDEVYIRHADADSVSVRPVAADRTDKNAELVAGLRALADFYEQHPDMPVPDYPNMLVGIDADTDEQGAAIVSEAARRMGAEYQPPGVPLDVAEHHVAETTFGPVKLRVYYIPEALKDDELVTLKPGDTVVRGGKS